MNNPIIKVGADKGVIENAPAIQIAGALYRFTVVTGRELVEMDVDRCLTNLTARAIQLGYTPIPAATSEMQLVIEANLIKDENWKKYGLDDVTVILRDCAFTYRTGTQWTHLPDSFFMKQCDGDFSWGPPRCKRTFGGDAKFLFLAKQ